MKELPEPSTFSDYFGFSGTWVSVMTYDVSHFCVPKIVRKTTQKSVFFFSCLSFSKKWYFFFFILLQGPELKWIEITHWNKSTELSCLLLNLVLEYVLFLHHGSPKVWATWDLKNPSLSSCRVNQMFVWSVCQTHDADSTAFAGTLLHFLIIVTAKSFS